MLYLVLYQGQGADIHKFFLYSYTAEDPKIAFL